MTIAPSLEFYVRRTHIWGCINLLNFYSGQKRF